MTNKPKKGAHTEELWPGSMCYKPRDLKHRATEKVCLECKVNKHKRSFPNSDSVICKACIKKESLKSI